MEIRTTEVFDDWFDKLKDGHGKSKITSRIDRMMFGNFGDSEPVGEGVSEMRIGGKGPGYRVYYTQQGKALVILLVGGDKSSQSTDIKKAKAIAAAL